jgi:protein-tyrosine phosphatase
VEESVLSVIAAAREKGLGIRILPGMEFDLDETLPLRASSIPGGAGHMLVDIGFWGVPRDLGELVAKVMDSGADVLLVHPERNRDLCRMRQELSRLISTGVKLVGNLGSFSGMYGRKVRRDARDLLKHGFYWAVASDLHSPDQSDWIKDGLKELAQLAGGSTVQELTSIRPMQLIEAMENGH